MRRIDRATDCGAFQEAARFVANIDSEQRNEDAKQ